MEEVKQLKPGTYLRSTKYSGDGECVKVLNCSFNPQDQCMYLPEYLSSIQDTQSFVLGSINCLSWNRVPKTVGVLLVGE